MNGIICCVVRYASVGYLILASHFGFAETTISSKVSLNFRQAQITTVLQALAEHQKLNLVMMDNTDQIITLKLNDVEWQTALDIVLNTARLEAVRQDNLLYISIKPNQINDLERLKKARMIALYQAPLVYLKLNIDYVDAETIVNMIKQQDLLSERGTIFFDKSSSKIIIYDIADQFSAIKTLVSEFDQPLPQVQIQAHIVTMNDESLNSLGISWGYDGHRSQTAHQVNIDLAVMQPTVKLGVTLANLSSQLLNLELSALEAENQVEIIASPSLLTTNLRPATIRQGAEIPYEVSSGKNGTVSIEFKQAVLGLTVTPRVLRNGYIELDLQISQNTAGQAIKRAEGGEALTIDTQEIQTHVIVKRGQTLVLGGIFQQSKTQHQRQVPSLSQLPVVGHLFRYQQMREQRRELVIFITPEIIERPGE
ncbi:hypothetical protein RHO15_03920 [Utexia brackfieldae]|uniref:type IV pilus secretin PilQ n=1 Tax=Utexia brackfieldae TaxID=3074108 RepID=UPI00370D0CE7